MRFLRVLRAFIYSRWFCYLFESAYKKDTSSLDREGVLRMVKAIKAQNISPRLNGFLDVSKLLIAAYFVRPGQKVIDAGAHVGCCSSYYSALVGNGGQVDAYEAHPLVFRELNRRVSQLRNVHCHNFAISSNSDQQIEMMIYPDLIEAQCATVVPSLMNVERMPGNTKLISVTTKCLDSMAQEDDPLTCSLIKIDVEGHEEAVIQGAKTLIAHQHPVIIYEYGRLAGKFEPTTIRDLADLGYISYDCNILQQVYEGYDVPITDLVAIPEEKQQAFESLASLLRVFRK